MAETQKTCKGPPQNAVIWSTHNTDPEISVFLLPSAEMQKIAKGALTVLSMFSEKEEKKQVKFM